MDKSTLQQFRNQLADWIKGRLQSGQFPFQRLGLDFDVVTGSGRAQADLVLWINRHSLITGSILLLPKQVDEETLTRGSALATSLGLGHFVTWGAREVTIWGTESQLPMKLEAFSVPSARDIRPTDFSTLIDRLLARLKTISVTTALSTEDLPPHYYLNLCLTALDDLQPDLAAQVRQTAAGIHSDNWVAQVTLDTAWLSLWRVLALTWIRPLPPGIQPERLEQAILYALSSLPDGPLSLLQEKQDEPALGSSVAVRFHHLISRLKQLCWPRVPEQAASLIALLLTETARDFGLTAPVPPWGIGQPQLWVNTHPPADDPRAQWVAPRSYLAGVALYNVMMDRTEMRSHLEQVTSLTITSDTPSIFAQPIGATPPDRNERERRLISLRQVWPNRRFDISRKMPAYLWDALHLLGVQSSPNELCLAMPCGWNSAPGSNTFWQLACERYTLHSLAEVTGEKQLLRLVTASETVQIHRPSGSRIIPANLLAGQSPGIINVLLHATDEIIDLLLQGRLTTAIGEQFEWATPLAGGLWLFTRTSMGRYLWEITCPRTELPQRTEAGLTVAASGMPLPPQPILAALEQYDRQNEKKLPAKTKLDRELQQLMGPLPHLPEVEASQNNQTETASDRQRHRGLTQEIVTEVFRDGIPRFPDHYLRHHFQPKVQVIKVMGPLSIAESFFERTLLFGPDDFSLEVTGSVKAEVLVLASYSGCLQVNVPEDDDLGREILERYRADLGRLWQRLLQECRNRIPHRQAALKVARRIWRASQLPPSELFLS